MSPEPTVTWRLRQLEWELEAAEPELRRAACREVGLDPGELAGFRIARQALDARVRNGRRRLKFVGHVDLVLPAERARRGTPQRARLEKAGRLVEPPPPALLAAPRVHASFSGPEPAHVAIVGAGPAGLAAALAFAASGVACTVIERGPPVRERSSRVVRFHRTRVPDPEGNLLFGEGGAGTYSDGKIYTRIDHELELALLAELVDIGAPPEIAYDALAHIGTDRLHRMLPRLRAKLSAAGTTFLWNTRLEGLVCEDGAERRVRAVRTTAGEIRCDALLLALGHSARDTWRALSAEGLPVEPRAFQLGLRIEHPQELVDRGRYGAGPAAARLGAASYNLVSKGGPAAPGAHSFCMCPGGRIVASVHAPGLLCTNGMSNSRHSSRFASAALVTTLGPEHFGREPFDGVRFQEDLERRFFEAGGGDYTAPAQTARDFLAGRKTAAPGPTSYPFGCVGARLDELVPRLVREALGRALERFERMLPGFASDAGLFVGVETRSSGPLRVPRSAERRAQGFLNLFALGEGAGYAGGIMSAMIDGAAAARDLAQSGVRGR